MGKSVGGDCNMWGESREVNKVILDRAAEQIIKGD